MVSILDQHGQPIASRESALVAEISSLRRQMIKGKYDAAGDSIENAAHWLRADNLDPHAAANPVVRRKLRSRSRYEVLENNPYLKGTLLTISNDFVGAGPRLRITDKRISREKRQLIEMRFRAYSKSIKLRKKLWRMKLAKMVDGESFAVSYINNKLRHPVKIDYTVIETDQVSSAGVYPSRKNVRHNEIDGIRFDDHLNPLYYRLLHRHPGSNHYQHPVSRQEDGVWINQKHVLHWFRQDRGWLRGIPELTPSLTLCSILRRYTLAIVRWAETSSSITGVIETEAPAGQDVYRGSNGSILADDPFDTFPVERGMLMNLPWGYTMKQLDGVPLGVQYDEFVGSVLREITSPLLVPYNIVSGTSKDNNMSGSVVDQHVYKEGQKSERRDCDEELLEQILDNWWEMGIVTPDYFDEGITGGSNFLRDNPSLRNEPPTHEFGWDNIGLEHTDPSKVAAGIETLVNLKHLTDRDVQETIFNRDVDDWREEVREDVEFRKEVEPEPEPTDSSGSQPAAKSKPKPKSKT